MKKIGATIGTVAIGGMGLASFIIGITSQNIWMKIFMLAYCTITVAKPVYDYWYERLQK